MTNKNTQGQKKFTQIFNDVRRHKYYFELLGQIKKKFEESFWDTSEAFSEGDDDRAPEDNLVRLVTKTIDNLDKKTRRKISQIVKLIAKKYGIDYDMFCYVIAEDIFIKNPNFSTSYKLDETPDMCQIRDRYLTRNITDEDIKTRNMECFPVCININKIASKRDVLDFINQKWEDIDSYLSFFRKSSLRIRGRKIGYEIIDFIWKNRNLPRKEINKLIRQKFGRSFGYEGVAKIISLEKRRRLGKLP